VVVDATADRIAPDHLGAQLAIVIPPSGAATKAEISTMRRCERPVRR